jgi:hypothetical protein
VARHKGAAIAAAAEAAGQPPDFLGPDAALPSNPRRAGGPLIALLDDLVPAVDPLAQFWAAQDWPTQEGPTLEPPAQDQGPLTYGRLLPAGDALLAAVNRLEEAATFYQGVLDRCSRLPPIPLPAVPLGY